MNKSIFTQIIEGTIPCHKIYEDQHVIAILDIHPMSTGHTLLIPKQQIDHLWDLPAELYEHMWRVAKNTITPALQQILKPIRVGAIVEGFGVPHAHIHLIPINTGEELKQHQDLGSEPDHAALAKIAEQLKKGIDEIAQNNT